MGQFFAPLGGLFNLIFTFPIFNLLMFLYHLIGDFGLSIIVLTLVIRLLLFPVTLKQLQSTKAMQALQPQLAELRKKYTNQQEQALAMQALYKEYNVNPVAGCLPAIIQLPVLYGLFIALSSVLRDAKTVGAINQNLYPFVKHFTTFPDLHLRWFSALNESWFILLSQPDPTHLLPILAGIATFIQMRMSQAKNAQTSGAKDAMTQQMQMMQYFMPLMIVFFAWNYPAGLALYWATSTVFSIVQQYFITGWGSLFTTPTFGGGSGNVVPATAGAGGRVRSSRVAVNTPKMVDAEVATVDDSDSDENLRRRAGSASARRRNTSSNNKKKRARG